MNLHVPALAPGAHSLPAELRVPHGNAFGWNRLHGNLTPLTEGAYPEGMPFHQGVSGLGADTTALVPVDLPVAIRTFPNMQSATAHDALDAVSAVQARYSPQAAAAVAAVLQRITAQASPSAVASLQRFLSRSQPQPMPPVSVSGLGYYDASGTWQPDESPYPVVMDTTTAGSIDWASIIASGSQSLANILAISQGGSVTNTGVYGSPGTASVAAGSAQGNLNIGASGISGTFTTPMILIGVGLIALIAMKGK